MQSLWRLLRYIKPYKVNVGLNIVSNILMVLFSIISIPALIPFLEILLGQEALVTEQPTTSLSAESFTNHFYYYLSQIIVSQGRERALIYMCGFIVIIYFFKNVFRYLSLFFMAPVRNGIVRDIRQQLFDKIMILPLSYFSKERKGDLISRTTADVQEIEWSILNVLEAVIREPLMIIGALGIMIYFSPSLTVFVFILLIFTAIVIGSIGKVLKRQSSKVQEKLGSIVSILEEGISGLRIIKAFNASDYQSKKFEQENNDYRNLLTRLLWRRDLSSPLSEFLGIAIVTVLIWYGYREVQLGILTVPKFLAFLYAFFSIIAPAKSFSSAFYNIQKGIAAVERVETVLDAEVTIKETDTPKTITNFEQLIEYKNVSFYYNEEEEAVLKNISISVPKGKSVALVGASGAGKSTLVDLLPRFYDVTKGGIFIDGINIKEYTIESLRSLTGIVSQEAILFNDSIYNNIVFGMKDVSKADVINAAKIANAHEFILATEKGYDTNIGDRGTKLSGGQRQRLTIARAVLKNPPILILDEATSALDSESEKLVQDALLKLMKSRTSIVIAHRLSTIQHADEIIVMQQGKIIERGNHKELLKKQGEYRKLVQLQAF